MTLALKRCPFCRGEAHFERLGNWRQSCIVTCTHCGARHESSDEDERCGESWNRRPDEQYDPQALEQMALQAARGRHCVERAAWHRDNGRRNGERACLLVIKLPYETSLSCKTLREAALDADIARAAARPRPLQNPVPSFDF